ncbi:MAG: DUF885 domain-containing protein [Verrucomicrobia bacterium]|nr:DUF885 domain-containing protein [Verrucomicrobiota bacterium]
MKFPSACLALVLACVPLLGRAAAPTFDQWADDFAARWVHLNPQFATRTQYFSGAEQDAIDRQLACAGAFGQLFGANLYARYGALARQGLADLQRFPAATLTPTQRTSAAIIRWTLENTVRNEPFARHHFVFEQFGGLHLGLVNFLTSTHPIRNARDVENYLVRLAQVAPRLDEGIAESKAAAAAGLLPPRFIVERVLEQLDGFLAHPATQNVFVTTLDQRIGALGAAVTAAQRAAWVDAAEKEVATAVLPAFQRVRDLMAGQLPQTTDDAGVWRLPRGDEYYATMLATSTTTTMTPQEIHAIGLREVARIEREMDQILRQLGYKDGTIQQRVEQLNATLLPPAEPDPRPALREKVEGYVHDAERRSVAVFDLLPKAPVTVKREPPFSEKSAAAHYTDPAPDGTRPGIYWLPMADLTPRVTWLGAGAKTTAYHEAVPGHHFQITIQQESTELPRYRKLGVFGFNSAFIEGWALYAERLADENGWYDGDLPGRLGYLNAQLFRARRLVVDTGIHAMKWTRQQVIDYGFTPTETERYIVWPGQACSYMIGQLRILALRDQAKAALGPRFSIKEFHNLVLRGGTMPLDVLAQEVDRWIANGGR